jgi:hypothetical protein
MTKKLIYSLCIFPLILLGIDSDLEQMNYSDNEKSKDLSPLFTTRAGYAYSEWKIPEMKSFKQEIQGLNLAWIDLIYKGNRDNVDGNRNYLHYERSFNNNWNDEIIRQENAIKNKDIYELLLAKLTFSSLKNIFIEASMERYLTRITSNGSSLFIDNNEKDHYLYKGDSLGFETKFNEIKLGLSTNPVNNGEYVNYFLFFGDYQKPYTIRKDNKEIDEFSKYLFYSKIQTMGLGASGIATLGGFYINSEFKFGGGKIKLTNNHDLEDFNIKSLTFFQAKIKLGYEFQILKSIKNLTMHIQALYDIRYFDESQEGTTYVGESTTNKEDIKKAFISLQYNF